MNPLGLFLKLSGPLFTRLHAFYMGCSECLPTRLNPLAEGTCFSQAPKGLSICGISAIRWLENFPTTFSLNFSSTSACPPHCCYLQRTDVNVMANCLYFQFGGICGKLQERHDIGRARKCGRLLRAGWRFGVPDRTYRRRVLHARWQERMFGGQQSDSL